MIWIKALVRPEGVACLALHATHETSLRSARNSPLDCFALAGSPPAEVSDELVRPEGVEPPASRLEVSRSILLSYGRF